MDGENLELFLFADPLQWLHGKEMQNKNKNNRKVTKLPTAKLIEIAVANWKNGHNLEILSCTKALPIFPDWKLYEIGNLLARFSYESRSYSMDIMLLAIESEGKLLWFPLRIHQKISIKSRRKKIEPL